MLRTGGVLSCFSKVHFKLLRASSADDDPLLPAHAPSASADYVSCLTSELLDDGFGTADAAELAQWLCIEELPRAATRLAKRLAKLRKSSDTRMALVELQPGGKPGIIDVRLGEVSLQLSEHRLAILRVMYREAARMHSSGGQIKYRS